MPMNFKKWGWRGVVIRNIFVWGFIRFKITKIISLIDYDIGEYVLNMQQKQQNIQKLE